MVGGVFALGIGVMLFILALWVVSTIFWIVMLVDCAKRNFRKENDKIVWILAIVFTGIIGAIIYYFVVKNKQG